MPTYITTGLTGGGTTTHFQVAYDSTLSTALGKDLGNSLIPFLDSDLALIQSWFGISLAAGFSSPISLHINTGGGGGADWWPPPTSPTLLEIFPDGGTTFNIARMIVAAEVVEMYEWSMPGKPWWGSPNEGRQGEALSQFAATEVLVQQGAATGTPTNYSTGLSWFPSARLDYINSNDPAGGGRDAPTGCAVLFLSYLKYQLGFTLPQIIAAAPTPALANTYHALTGDVKNPFPPFKTLLAGAYPGTTSPATSVLGDNPWPLSASLALARHTFGGGPADFVATVKNGGLAPVSATITFWTARTGGSQITDLLDANGNPVTSITTDGSGQFPPFQGPADNTGAMWADAGGARALMQANDLPARVAALEGSGVTIDGGAAS